MPGPGVKAYTAAGCTGGSDGTAGNSTDDGACCNADLRGDVIYSTYIPTEDGTVTYGHMKPRRVPSGDYCRIGLWSSTGTLLARGTAVQEGDDGAPQVMHFALENVAANGTCLVAATTYIVGYVCDGSDTEYYVETTTYVNGGLIYKQIGSMSTDLANFSPSPTAIAWDFQLVITLNNSADTF